MKVIAYSIKNFEKQPLAKANHKRHDITLISNALSITTCDFADGKKAVLVSMNDDVSAPVINKLADLGIKYIATRSTDSDHIDKNAAKSRAIKLASVPAYAPTSIAEHAVAMAIALHRNLAKAEEDSHWFNFDLDVSTGLPFSGKTVGIIGLGNTGQAAAAIFDGLGCRVLGYDIVANNLEKVNQVSLETLFHESDIISLHLPLSPESRHMINASSIALMKDGVMLINTSRGALINTLELPHALDQGKIGYLGMDVYEFEDSLFYTAHPTDTYKNPLLMQLLKYPNVIITPHQAFFANEAVAQIATTTIQNLNDWETAAKSH